MECGAVYGFILPDFLGSVVNETRKDCEQTENKHNPKQIRQIGVVFTNYSRKIPTIGYNKIKQEKARRASYGQIRIDCGR